MSRNNSVSTTSTTHSSSLASTATTQTSLSSVQSCKNHIISDFNPTLVLHIPPHGAFKKPRTDIDIHDITPLLPGYNHNTSMIQDSVGVGDIKALVAGRRWSEGDSTGSKGARGAGGDLGEKNALGGLALVSRRHRRWGSRSTVQSTLEERIYTESAEWRVPWNITKPSTITLKSVGEDRKIDVWCGKEDRRAQLWAMEGGVSYVWRWAKDEEGKEELILEKEGGGMGSHRIGWFLFKKSPSSHNPLTPSSGTLILDERGLSRIVAVTSILIFLKRDRQRRTMGGRT